MVVIDILRKVDEMNLTLINRLKKEKEELNKEILLVLNKVSNKKKTTILFNSSIKQSNQISYP